MGWQACLGMLCNLMIALMFHAVSSASDKDASQGLWVDTLYVSTPRRLLCLAAFAWGLYLSHLGPTFCQMLAFAVGQGAMAWDLRFVHASPVLVVLPKKLSPFTLVLGALIHYVFLWAAEPCCGINE